MGRRLLPTWLMLSLATGGGWGCAGSGGPQGERSVSPYLIRAQTPGMYAPSRYGPEPFTPLRPGQSQNLIVHPLLLRDALVLGLRNSNVIKVLEGDVTLSRTTRLDPQIAATEIDRQEGAFNPTLQADFEGTRVNQPPDAYFGPGIQTDTRRDQADYSASIKKPWATGTELSLAYSPPLGYLYFPNSTDPFNPTYASDIVVQVRQKLLQGGNSDSNLAPIRIAQLRTTQSEASVREATNQQIRSIKQAYWRLQAAYQLWASLDRLLHLTAESVRIEELRYRMQQVAYSDVARATIRHQSLRQQWLAAQFAVTQRELQLKNLIGIPADERTKLLPVDPLPESWPAMHWPDVVSRTLTSNLDLRQKRLELDILGQQLIQAENSLLPQLDLSGNYRVSGLATRLDDAFVQMNTFDYSDWTVGLNFSVPLGNQAAKAVKSSKELQLARERALLTEQEQQLIFQLQSMQEQLRLHWDQYHSAVRQVELSREWIRVSRLRYLQPVPGSLDENWLLVALADYQSAMQSHVAAVRESSENLADFNILLARLTELQGQGLEEWNIQLAQPPVPAETLQTWATLGFGHTAPRK